MSTLLVVNGTPSGSETPCDGLRPADDDLVAGVRLTAIHDLAAAVAHRRIDLRL